MRTIAIVTGASRGLGEAFAQQLAKECTVLITVSRHTITENIQHIAQQQHCQLHHFSLDLADPQDLAQLCNALPEFLSLPAERYLLINNAGSLGPMAQYHGLSPDKTALITQTFAVNVSAAITLSSAFLTLCQAHTNAKIQVINISSGAARNAYPGWAVYCASKAALDRYTEVVKLEAPFAQIVSLAPGVVDTSMQSTIRASNENDFPKLQRFKDLHTNQELSSANEVASKILAYSLSPAFAQQTLSDIRLI